MKTLLYKTVLFFFIMLLFIYGTNAQIVYTDVSPDQVFSDSGSVYHLDLNKDGVNDFDIAYTKQSVTFSGHCNGTQTNYSICITPKLSNAVLSDVNYYPYALNLNDAISPGSASWSSTAGPPLRSASWRCTAPAPGCHICIYHLTATLSGNWSDTADRYLGLKFIKGANTYFGWARLSVSANGFAIKDYAYSSNPNDSIFAGQMNSAYTLISSITAPPYCAGRNISVSYLKGGNGIFTAANIFTVQLSDSNGSFANHLSIGSKQGTAGGTISATIPSSAFNGSKYRLRIISSSPSSVSSDNGVNIVIDHALATATISSDGPAKICLGNSVTLSTPNIAGYSYQWVLNGTAIQGATNPYISAYGSDTTKSYYYKCIVSNACGSVTSKPDTITAEPLPTPGYITASGPTTFCKGGSVTLSVGANAGLTYQWYHNDSAYYPIPGATGSSYFVNSTGAYDVEEINKFGCSLFANNTIWVIVPDIPKPGLLLFNGSVWKAATDTTICLGDSLWLFAQTNSYYSEDYQYQYNWFLNGVNISSATSNYYYAKSTGTYTVKISDMCGSTTTQGIKLTTKKCTGPLANSLSINEESISSGTRLNIAPNPFSNNTSISFTLPQSQKVIILIFDLNGRLIRTLADAQMQAGIHQIIWNATNTSGSAVASGMYYLKLIAGNYSETKKIAVHK